jgi:hypothetical protein
MTEDLNHYIVERDEIDWSHCTLSQIDLDLINYAFELNVTEKYLQKNKKHMN